MTEIAIPPDRPVFVGGLAAHNAEMAGSDKPALVIVPHESAVVSGPIGKRSDTDPA